MSFGPSRIHESSSSLPGECYVHAAVPSHGAILTVGVAVSHLGLAAARAAAAARSTIILVATGKSFEKLAHGSSQPQLLLDLTAAAQVHRKVRRLGSARYFVLLHFVKRAHGVFIGAGEPSLL